MQVVMTQKKETAGTVVYESNGDDPNPICKSIYLAKTAMGKKRPKSITVTVDFAD